MPLELLIVAAVLALLGVLLVFAGLRLFTPLMGAFGFVVGGALPVLYLNRDGFTSWWLAALICIGAGGVLAWVVVSYPSVAVAVLVGSVAAWLAPVLVASVLPRDMWPVVPGVAAALGAVLALRFRTLLAIVFTALVGAQALTVALLVLLGRIGSLPELFQPARWLRLEWPLLVGAVVAALGIGVQLALRRPSD